MNEVLIINGHDYSKYIESKGVAWSRNDLDSAQTTRTKEGTMRRQKITTKRKLQYTMLPMPLDAIMDLDDDLNSQTFSATYLDLHGVMTREFYCSSFSTTLNVVEDGMPAWDGAAFSMTEI